MNYKRYVLLFNIFFLLLLLSATFIFERNPGIAGDRFKPLDILSDVMKDTASHQIAVNNNKVIRKDLHTQQQDYTSYAGIINNTTNPTALFDFSGHLHDLVKKKRKKIRIGYFGDSMVEGDLVTQDIRRMLQDKFGGSGVGFVPITSIVAGFRQTIIHSFTSDWDDVSFKSDNRIAGHLFISGHSFFSGGNSVVSYRAVNQPHLDHFNKVSVLYGMPQSGEPASASLLVNGITYPIHAVEPVNMLNIDLNNGQELKLGNSSTAIPLYGAAFETDSGIVVDNFSFRGISGIELDYFSPDYLKKLQEIRPYDLLIFHYGPNLLFKPNLTDFSWYIKKMQPTLQKIKNAFPGTSLLVISTADKGFRYNGEWHTAKGVRPLIDAQYGMSSANGIDFFNLYNAMGGEDAIVRWVNSDTALANKDYTHANFRGARKFAEYIFNAIMKAYREYEKLADK